MKWHRLGPIRGRRKARSTEGVADALSLLALAPIGIILFGALSLRSLVAPGVALVSAGDATLPPEGLVVLTDDHASGDRGETMAVFQWIENQGNERFITPVGRGSPGRLAASPRFDRLITQKSGGSPWNVKQDEIYQPFVRILESHDLERRAWLDRVITGEPFQMTAAPAIMPDGETLLIALSRLERNRPLNPPCLLVSYRWSEIGESRMGPRHGSLMLDGIPFAIFPNPDGVTAHVVTTGRDVRTIDVRSMTDIAPPILSDLRIPPDSTDHWDASGGGFAAITPNGRYILATRWPESLIEVYDLAARSFWSIAVPDLVRPTGISISLGLYNHGLVAVRALSHMVVYRMEGDDKLVELRRKMRVGETSSLWPGCFTNMEPVGGCEISAAVSWSEDGAYLITAGGERNVDFEVYGVTEGAGTIRLVGEIVISEKPGSQDGIDVLTRSRYHYLYPTPTPSPTATPTDPPSATPSATVTPSLTPTASGTGTAPPEVTSIVAGDGRLYLPITLRQSCRPAPGGVDVLLLIDASSSMREPAGAVSKIEAARRAAHGLVEGLGPGDRAGLVAFAAEARLLQDFSAEPQRLHAAIEGIQTDEGTRIDRALALAGALFREATGRRPDRRLLVLVSDGRPDPGTEALTFEAAEELRAVPQLLHYTVGFGEAADPVLLARLASHPGAYLHAPGPDALEAVMRGIAAGLRCPDGPSWTDTAGGGPVPRGHSDFVVSQRNVAENALESRVREPSGLRGTVAF